LQFILPGPKSDGKAHIRMGKLNLVDLAGSERQDKVGIKLEVFVGFCRCLPLVVVFSAQ
jgi:hypothetical protein